VEAPGEVGVEIKKIVEKVLSKNAHLKTTEAIANFLKRSDSKTFKWAQPYGIKSFQIFTNTFYRRGMAY